MKVKARLLCRKGQSLGTIQIIAYYRDQQKEISLGRKIESSRWDDVSGQAKGYEYQLLNIQIRNAIRDITDMIDRKVAAREAVDLNDVFDVVFGKKRMDEAVPEAAPLAAIMDVSTPDEVSLTGFLRLFIDENPDKIDQASMNSYRTLLTSLEKFGGNGVKLTEVDVYFVNKYYDFLRTEGKLPSTIQTRFKKLKKIVNTAITRGLMKDYPFGKGKLTIPGPKNIKRKFLNDSEIKSLLDYEPKNDSEVKVMRIVKFNLHVGLRIGDIFTLRKCDIIVQQSSPAECIYRLAKTTAKTDTDINIKLTKQAVLQLIEGGFERLADHELVFPGLNESDFDDEVRLYKAISAKTAYFNKVLAMICHKAGVRRISSHSLRHTFCTSLLSKGVPITSISKLVGHSDVTTTMIYSQIVQETVDDAISVLER